MSVTAGALAPSFASRNRLLVRVGLALAAVAIVGGALALLAWLVGPAAPPPRNPFGLGVREAAPSAGGLGGFILALQGEFYRSLQAAVGSLKQNGAAIWSLIAVAFAYGVFHAAGPGHGKAVIAAYLVSHERALAKGFGMSLAAALVQATVAVVLVGTVAAVFRATAATMSQISNAVEITSYAAVTALGLLLVWRKAGKLLGAASGDHHRHHHAHEHGCDHSCGHAHMPSARDVDGARGWREMAAVVLAAGIRPCAGAIIVLVFALSQGLFPAGIAATFAMALGTALTTGLIAALAVFARALAIWVAQGRAGQGARIVAAGELLAAAFVLVLGASLLAGLWTGAAAS